MGSPPDSRVRPQRLQEESNVPVQQDQFQVTPYTSTVPTVQIPPDAIEAGSRPAAPLQGNVLGKGTGALAIGDSLLKGFMMGHQQKEQKKALQAQATINAADAATESAYQQYQDALTKAGGKVDDPAAKAAYDAYTGTFNAGKQAKAQFVIPEKGQKGKKAAGDSDPVKSPDDKKKKNPVSAGFNNIKDFFEANPHIVPQIALMTMQPKPQGLSPQGQEQVQSLETGKLANEQKSRQLANEKTYQDGFATYAHLSPDEISALPPESKKGYEAWQNARAAITPTKFTGATRLYKLSNGKQAWLYPEEASMYYPDAEAIAPGSQLKPGTEAYFQTQYATANNLDPTNIPPETTKYLHDVWAWKQANQPGSVSTSTTDPQGNRTTTTKKTAPPPPQPPPGVAPVGEMGLKPPPTAGQKAPAASGGITKPPTAGASPTAQGVPSTAPQGSTQFTVGAKPQGMVEEGNLPIWNRPAVQNGDGSHSSEYSTSFEQDGKEVLVPTVVSGKFLTPDGKKPKPGSPEEKAMFKAAWQHYLDTGENLGKFKNAKDADAYANALHNRGAAKSTSKGGIAPPPKTGKTAAAGITPPPGGKQTATTAAVTRQAVKTQQEGYRKAEAKYTKALADADKAFAAAQKTAATSGDPSVLTAAQTAKDRAYARAQLDLMDDKDSVAKEYDTAVKSIGGTPGSQSQSSAQNPPPGATARVKDANGNLIGYAVNGQFVPLGQ